MARVTEEEVQAIMEEYPDDLTPFMTVASLLVEEELVPIGVLSDDRLKEIERWLSAHFAAVRTPLATQEGAGPVTQSNQRGSPGKGLASTQYGQNAISLDTTGTLAALAEGTSTSSAMIDAVLEDWQ